MLFLEANLRC